MESLPLHLTDEQSVARARRRTLATFGALTALVGFGLFVWNPVPGNALTHHQVDARTWLGVPNAANVLVNVPVFWCAAWGWCATRTSPWTRSLRLPWQGFHLWVMLASLFAAMYHAAPSDERYLASQVCSAGAAVMLCLGLMAERLDRRWGAVGSCAAATAVVTTFGFASLYALRVGSGVDIRACLLLQALPLLLVLAGTLRLQPERPLRSGWVAVLGLYVGAHLLDWADAAIFATTGFISGHTLMHVSTGLIVAWMAYRASAEAGTRAGESGDTAGATTQRSTSLNTSG